ncbi:uncharacterized protein EI90DRAFT_3095002 [Cantharellus anzutake]|uniref:uncharacterized protein n=1 Tax=Cantharellus anzutake TaxID=1750568 RepID=UPI001905D69B|nr:uncharacterized protein EI90DRAFT_3095002 [Cantharellus anzutake]KAF8311928.1 hypothetical protein EI90DRAFT_3095002 [Cantharellus anzutake]
MTAAAVWRSIFITFTEQISAVKSSMISTGTVWKNGKHHGGLRLCTLGRRTKSNPSGWLYRGTFATMTWLLVSLTVPFVCVTLCRLFYRSGQCLGLVVVPFSRDIWMQRRDCKRATNGNENPPPHSSVAVKLLGILVLHRDMVFGNVTWSVLGMFLLSLVWFPRNRTASFLV